MADDDGRRPAVSSAGAERRTARASKAAAALRTNLQKRKAQQRGREGSEPTRAGDEPARAGDEAGPGKVEPPEARKGGKAPSGSG